MLHNNVPDIPQHFKENETYNTRVTKIVNNVQPRPLNNAN